MKKTIALLTLSVLFLFGLSPLSACGGEHDQIVPESDSPKLESPELFPSVPSEETPPKEPTQEDFKAQENEEKNETPELPASTPPAPSSETQTCTQTDYLRVLVSGLNVRAGAGTNFKSLGQVEKDVLLDYKGKSGNWYETAYQGQVAYVSAKPEYTEIVKLQSEEEAVEAVISVGTKFLGVPYVYGATRYHDGKGNLLKGFSTAAFDCSSLMQYIFYRGANVKLDVTTRTQIKQGVFVSKSDIKRGDLLFFTNASRYYNTGIERVGHVALYLGENYILHTASDYAKIEQISIKRWSYFLEARRVL